jgi:hypothetical protein
MIRSHWCPRTGNYLPADAKTLRAPETFLENKKIHAVTALKVVGSSGLSSVTVLFTSLKMAKTFNIDEAGQIATEGYSKAKQFRFATVQVEGIKGLATLISTLSKRQDAILIRGLPRDQLQQPAERTGANFAEDELGCRRCQKLCV